MRSITIAALLTLCACALMGSVYPAYAQIDGDDFTSGGDTLTSDDSVEAPNADDIFFSDIEDDDFGAVDEPGFFRVRGGFFGGPIVEFTSLKPADLDPVLDGQLVIFGAEGCILLESWLLGGGGMSAHLYDMSPAYDRFEYGYGGFLAGYDTRIFHGVMSLRGSIMIGAGGLEMLKKRPDLGGTDGPEILERYREEGFFLLRPGASIGVSPLPFVEFRLGVNYLLPFGGSRVDDLRNLSYGLHIMLGIGN